MKIFSVFLIIFLFLSVNAMEGGGAASPPRLERCGAVRVYRVCSDRWDVVRDPSLTQILSLQQCCALRIVRQRQETEQRSDGLTVEMLPEQCREVTDRQERERAERIEHDRIAREHGAKLITDRSHCNS